MKRALWGVLAAAAVLYLFSVGAYYVGFFNDDAFYVIGARALLHGRYAELNAPGQPPLVNYLPGYPLLLAPVAAVAGGALWPFQILSVALTVASLWLVWLYFEEAPAPARLAAVAAAAFSPLVVSMSGTVLSDVPLLAVFAGAFLWARRVWQRRALKHWVGLFALCGFSALTRPTGAALPLALVAALFLERRFKLAAACAVIASAVPGVFLARNAALTGRSLMYFVEAMDPVARGVLVATIRANLAFYPKYLFVTTLFRWPAGGRTAEAATIALGVLACILAVGEEDTWEWRKFVQMTLAIFLGAHLLWSKQAGRYLFPVTPFVAGYVMWGLAVLAKEYGVKPGICWWAGALSVALSAAPAARIARAARTGDAEAARPAAETFAWLRANTAPGEVLAAELDGRVFLYTGRTVAHLRREPSPEALARWLASVRARYVVLLSNAAVMRTPSGKTEFDPVELGQIARWLSNGKRYRPVFSSRKEGSAVFEVAARRG